MGFRKGRHPHHASLSRKSLTCFSQVRAHLPGEYAILEAYIDVLPGQHAVPCYPFPGLVLNINVATRLHKDKGDDSFCVVVAFSTGQGGYLCLKELGLVCKTQSGDVLGFDSQHTTHFNTDYKGKRISFVFHTDGSSKMWTSDRNGWIDHQDMRTSRN